MKENKSVLILLVVCSNVETSPDGLIGKHHHIFNLVLGGELYCAPISDGVSRILDLGTGTGAWAIDMAE
jgi:hypothetical protein